MNESISDRSKKLSDFSKSIEEWIEKTYEWEKKPVKATHLVEIEPKQLEFTPDLPNFISNKITEFTDDWNPELIADFFHIFVKITFEKKSDQKPLFSFGDLYRAFDNIQRFKIQEKTIIFIKNKLLEGECDYNWTDSLFLEGIYKSLAVEKDRDLKFRIRNLIFLTIRDENRDKNRRLRDFNIKKSN